MKFYVAEEKRIRITQFLMLGFIFFIPLSPTIKSVFMPATLVMFFLTPHYTKHLWYAMNTPWARAGLLLFAFITVACFWSPANTLTKYTALSKYLKLVYLPILSVLYIDQKMRIWSINTYLAVMLITCIISILQHWGVVASVEAGQVAYNHIVTGFMLAFACYLSVLCALQNRGWKRLVYALLVILTSYQLLFINIGRAAYVVYFVLMCMLIIQRLPLKKAAVGLVLFSVLVSGAYLCSSNLQHRVRDLITDVHSLQLDNPFTSLGLRMQFYTFSSKLFLEKPVFGSGTGGYKYRFEKDNPVPVWGIGTSDPHSQYWLMLAEFGITGLLLLGLFIASLIRTAFKLKENSAIVFGIVMAFCLGSASDTLLCYSTVGYLLIIFCALCFGELIAAGKTSAFEPSFDKMVLNS